MRQGRWPAPVLAVLCWALIATQVGSAQGRGSAFKEASPTDIRQCSKENFPRMYSLLRMLTYWNPSITELPPDGGRAFDSLERVDVSTEEGRARLAELQRCEVPFKAVGHKALDKVFDTYKSWDSFVERYSRVSHSVKLTSAPHNHFMWFKEERKDGASVEQLADWQAAAQHLNWTDALRQAHVPREKPLTSVQTEHSARRRGYKFSWPPPTPSTGTFEDWAEEVKEVSARIDKAASLLSAAAGAGASFHELLRHAGNLGPLEASYSAAAAAHLMAAQKKGVGTGTPDAKPVHLTGRREDLASLRSPWGWWPVPPASVAASQSYPHRYLSVHMELRRKSSVRGADMGLFPIVDELDPVFGRNGNFMIVDRSMRKGPQCRVGQPGVIAEGHEDGHRNNIMLLHGAKRYILLPPSECALVHTMDRGPARRHWALDVADPTTLFDSRYTAHVAAARGVETVLRPGEVLYLPSMWHHYIVSLTPNFQCNIRSGQSPLQAEDKQMSDACIFAGDKPWDSHDAIPAASQAMRWWETASSWDEADDARAQAELGELWIPAMQALLRGKDPPRSSMSMEKAALLPRK